MVSESSDILLFLATSALFAQLSGSQLKMVTQGSYTAFGKAGDELNFGSRPDRPGAVILRTGSIEVRDADHHLLDRLSSGDFLLPEILYAQERPPVQGAKDAAHEAHHGFRVTVLEDCLYYTINGDVFRHAVSESAQLAQLCESYSHSLLPPGSPQRHRSLALSRTYLDLLVKDHMCTDLVCASPQMQIRDAAMLMTERRVSSLLITEQDQLAGILTDRDLRSRVIAAGLTTDIAVQHIMTSSPVSVAPDARLHDAQLAMMTRNIHHLPVVDQQRILGIISVSDLLKANNIEPLSLARLINILQTDDELGQFSRRLPELVVKLVEQDMRAVDVGEIISSLTDALTRRLLQLGEARFGEPPCRYCWLAFGSQARQEQAMVSDQDNAIVLDDEFRPEHDPYFFKLAEFVNDGLHRAGITWCPGGVMAKNPQWRLTHTSWHRRFTDWIDSPSPQALMQASIFFDARPISGDSQLFESLYEMVRHRASTHSIFQVMMNDAALHYSPPLGFFKQFVLERDGNHNQVLDLKRRGTTPIVGVARGYALSARLPQTNTLARLRAATAASILSRELSTSLIDAHEFIATIRLQAQCRKFRNNATVDNFLNPNDLSPLVRHQLKEAFHTVRDGQVAIKARLNAGVL